MKSPCANLGAALAKRAAPPHYWRMADGFSFFGTQIALNGQLALFFAVVFLAGVIRGYTGFGSALLVVPALAALYGPAQAVVIEVLIEVPISLALAPTALRHSQRRTVLPILLMFLIFVPVGALLLRWIDPDPLRVAISLVVLVMVGIMVFQNRLAPFLTPSGILVTGAIAGVLQGLTAIAGPLFVTAMLARGEDAQTTRANILVLAAGLIMISVFSFVAVGLVDMTTVTRALLAVPAVLAGVWLGSVLFAQFGHLNLRAVILVFLAVTAVVTLVGAVSG